MQLSERIGCRMKLHDLHVLMAVVQTGSMSKAASLLNTGQPAISRSIAELEHALGVRLLDRGRHGVRPTEYGRALLDGGTTVFDDLRQTVRKIAFLADPAVGEVRVGCSPILAAGFVTAIVDRLARRYPRAVFRLVPAYVTELYRQLTERNVDLLITRRAGSIADEIAGERLDYEYLFDDAYWVAAGAGNPWTRRRRVALAELVNEPWVLPPRESTTGAITMAAFRASGLAYPRTSVISEPVDMRINLLATGRFISIFTETVFRFSPRRPELKILPVTQRLSTTPVGIVTLKNRTLSPLARILIESARELAPRLKAGKRA
ncbi:MAG TPA: LysR family transcriptional regulator [Xanthobacteraceae bacterium]|nr:LysR family transcriptional regulator [Xanthobacteraceae bacterium]